MRALPQQLLNRLKLLDHFNEAAFVAAHAVENTITSIRLNPFKKVETDLYFENPVPWCEDGFYLKERPSFTLDPLFHAGAYYVQEAGSMFLEEALKQTVNFEESLTILDISAAPGGKSTAINSLMNDRSLLVSNEIIKSRADTLSYNLAKWGTTNTIVTNNDPSRFADLSGVFDLIVADAPCSGSGLFRKQTEAIDEWSEGHVVACSTRQRKILADIVPALKQNGILFYSTCSYSEEENEQIIEWLIRDHEMEFVPLSLGENWGIIESGRGYRFYPHLTKSEGFFCAVLRKISPAEHVHHSKKNLYQEISKSEKEIVSDFLPEGNELVMRINENIHAVSPAVNNFINAFGKQLYLKKAGVVVGEIKGRDLVPNHDLAICARQNVNLNKLEVDKDLALKFLRKESFVLSGKTKGFSLLTYKGLGLGWAKILPNRLNNYLPNELRILK